MSICVSWSTNHGCTHCRNRSECDELGLSPFDDATANEINALVDDDVLPESYRIKVDEIVLAESETEMNAGDKQLASSRSC